jgi:hypothetical protein
MNNKRSGHLEGKHKQKKLTEVPTMVEGVD